METWLRDPGAAGGSRRPSLPTRALLVQGLLVLAGLAVTMLGFLLFLDVHHGMHGYRTAPPCDSAAGPGADCRRYEGGRVTARKADGEHRLTVARETAPAATFDVDQDFYDDVQIGTNVQVTVFHARAVEISYRGHHGDNLRDPHLPALGVAALVAVGSALTVNGLARSRESEAGLASGPGIGLLAFVGASLLLQMPLPFAVTLGIPLVGWTALIATAAVFA
ncbi:hypothetical protein ACIQ9P_38440 [Kitasatospora sp. NPDC094019]|uniref:hypothetical protein n=1 Tax=Kitasatospora sp. NPDC094019 TaxID=3364091 RepID=UPI0038156E76